MKKRILSLVLCAAMLLSMCLFLGAGVTDEGETCKITVNYIYESDSSPVAQAAVLQVAKDEALTKEIAIPTQENYTPTLADDTPKEITLDVDNGILKFENFMPTGNVTVKVFYVAGNAKYTVNHYLQNLENDEYTLRDTYEMTGSIDAYTKAVANKYEGFTASEITQTPIAADNTTVVDIKYTRNYYMVQFDAKGGVNGPEPIYAKYDTRYDLPVGPTKAGYRFDGWIDSDGNRVTEGIVKANVTYTAKWEPISNEAGVTVVYWGQNANDNEYSYYGAVELANQNVDRNLTWDDVKSQTAYTCGFEEHKHTSDCKLTCAHAGSHAFALSCVGLDGAAPVDPNQYGDGDARTHFEDSCKKTKDCKKAKLKEHLKNGSVCQYKDGDLIFGTNYYYFLYFDGAYYKISSELYNQLKSNTGAQVTHGNDTYYVYEWNGKCLHKHTDACYDCGKITHTHTDSCKSALDAKMDSSLWTYEKSDTVTVDAAGNTIMNVYYTRKVFTLHFREAESSNDDYGTIQARWGKDISDQYKAIVAESGSSFWSEDWYAGEPWTNYIGVMPQTDKTYYRYLPRGSSTSTMTYYGEDLSGNDQVIFTISFKGTNYSVSDEDRYEFEGFTYDHGTSNGSSCNGATFYYSRNTYSLNFYSASSSRSDKTANVKFQAPLGSYDYTPTSKPASVESDAVFAGWYLNPQCTGEQYVLSEHKMPSNNIALYAKWVNRSYKVTTYTDDTQSERYTYDGYNGTQSVVKYEKGVAPTNPTRSGYVFVGWFYKEDGVEKPFSFEMGITKDYDLYPKWSNEVNVNYTIRYVDSKTGNPITGDDTGSARIGSSVTVKSKPIDGYFPEKTSTSVQINQDGQVITLYYVPATEQTYTVKYVELVNGEPRNIADSVTKTTSDQQVVETAKDIEGFTPDKYQKTLELTAGGENVVTFYYTKQVTIKYVPLEGGSVTPETETLIRTTGEAQGSTATPDASYKFVGWYNNEECTGDPVSMNATFVPQKENGVYKGATYYAKFELDVFDLTIKKTAKEGTTIDPNQIFVFHVVSDNHKTDMEVTVQGAGSVTIKGLPLGTTYTVTEDTGWTWQYKPDKSEEVFTPSGDYSVTFTNTYSKSNWLTSFAEVINKWIDGKIDPIKVKN